MIFFIIVIIIVLLAVLIHSCRPKDPNPTSFPNTNKDAYAQFSEHNGFEIFDFEDYQENMISVGEHNPNFDLSNHDFSINIIEDDIVYKTVFDNPYKASMEVCEDGTYAVSVGGTIIGHTKKGNSGRIRNLLSLDPILITAELRGGACRSYMRDSDTGKEYFDTSDPLAIIAKVTISHN